MLAFDSDVLIYSASPEHPYASAIWQVLQEHSDASLAVGSVLLLPELFIKPLRLQQAVEVEALQACVSKLILLPMTDKVAALAVTLGANYGLKAPDAIHLATAVEAGASQFLTNNKKDFTLSILELEVIYPELILDKNE